MAKAVIGYSGTTYGSEGSAGLGAVYGTPVTPAVVFTAALNPDGSHVKDTRT